ncbi:MAG: hypothetical protein KatS3mg090_0921 [Patescibacteria group bacterium]|nr:MAG: hypothetical protein KatS3mg090_0921 [Patescibacteria group bacterium]
MKAKVVLDQIISEILNSVSSGEQTAVLNNRLKNLIYTFLRKFTSQKLRVNLPKYKSYLTKKIYYFSKSHSLDYVDYVYSMNPNIPIDFLKEDEDEVLYFLRIYFRLVFKDGLDEDDFEGRWVEFERIRKEVGREIKFNILTNTYSLYGFKSIVYPDTGVFPGYLKINKLFKRKKYEAILDLGAYIGDTAYCFNKVFDCKKIYAFEPDPTNFEILKTNIKLNLLEDKIEAVPYATGGKNGYFYLTQGGARSSIDNKKSENSVKVKVMTIDDFVKKNKIKKVDLIKMDIEGAEFDTLKGAVKTLKRDKPDLLVAIYHKGEHFFEIPGWLKKQVPEYNLRFLAFNEASPIIERFIVASVRKI